MAEEATSTASQAGPTLRAFLGLKVDDRRAILKVTHPIYDAKAASWEVLRDAYEGSGGFEDGSYLWRFPREEEKEFNARKEQARYHNYAKSLVNLYVRHVFQPGVKRETTNEDLKAFWADCDGAKTEISDLMKRSAQLALAMGHEGVLVDKTPTPATGPSKADERARPIVVLFDPLAIKDWRQMHQELTAIKLQEDVDSPNLLESVDPAKDEQPSEDDRADACQYLIWSKTDGFLRVNGKGELIEQHGSTGQGNPALGLVPFTVLRPEPSAAHPFIGQSLLGNANVFKALLNRCSELDSSMRNSSFSMLTVSVPADGDASKVREEVGDEVGSTRAVVAKGTIDYVTPDQEVPAQLRTEVEFLVREIYRIAHVAEQRDSRDAESAEAIRLKNTELNEMLAGLAAALTSVEQAIVRFYFAWTTTSPDEAEAALEKAKVSITYPREFFTRELLAELEELAEAIALDLGLTMTQRLKLKAVQRLDPDIDEATREKVKKEIEAQPPPAPPIDTNALRLQAQGRLKQSLEPPPADGE